MTAWRAVTNSVTPVAASTPPATKLPVEAAAWPCAELMCDSPVELQWLASPHRGLVGRLRHDAQHAPHDDSEHACSTDDQAGDPLRPTRCICRARAGAQQWMNDERDGHAPRLLSLVHDQSEGLLRADGWNERDLMSPWVDGYRCAAERRDQQLPVELQRHAHDIVAILVLHVEHQGREDAIDLGDTVRTILADRPRA
jgi:hypothetical protein